MPTSFARSVVVAVERTILEGRKIQAAEESRPHTPVDRVAVRESARPLDGSPGVLIVSNISKLQFLDIQAVGSLIVITFSHSVLSVTHGCFISDTEYYRDLDTDARGTAVDVVGRLEENLGDLTSPHCQVVRFDHPFQIKL